MNRLVVASVIHLLILSARQHHLLARATDLLQHNAENIADLPDGSRLPPESWSAVMDSFVTRENVARYKHMLEMPNDVAARQVLLRLLAEEEQIGTAQNASILERRV